MSHRLHHIGFPSTSSHTKLAFLPTSVELGSREPEVLSYERESSTRGGIENAVVENDLKLVSLEKVWRGRPKIFGREDIIRWFAVVLPKSLTLPTKISLVVARMGATPTLACACSLKGENQFTHKRIPLE